jgi:hypothetical protein
MKMRKRTQAFCPNFCVQSADNQFLMKSALVKSLCQNEPKTGRKEEVRMKNEESKHIFGETPVPPTISVNSRKTLRLCAFALKMASPTESN